MLIIEDNADLKELEKFGFEPRYSETTGKIVRYIMGDERNVIRYIDNNHNFLPYWEVCLNNNNLLYDLIQAGIVEKV